jgi:hypothetical protein
MAVMADPIIIRYAPRPDATRQAETEALANVFAFLIERAESRKAAESGGGRQENREGGEAGRESGTATG